MLKSSIGICSFVIAKLLYLWRRYSLSTALTKKKLCDFSVRIFYKRYLSIDYLKKEVRLALGKELHLGLGRNA